MSHHTLTLIRMMLEVYQYNTTKLFARNFTSLGNYEAYIFNISTNEDETGAWVLN